MKKTLIKVLIVIAIIVLTALVYIGSNLLSLFVLIENLNLPDGVSFIVDFALLGALTYFCLKFFNKQLTAPGVLISIGIFLVFIIITERLNTSVKYILKLSPAYITWVLSMAAGYFFYIKQRNFKIPALLFIFPLLMAFGLNDLWVHKIEYGNFYGEVKNQVEVPFELTNKAGEIVDNESLKGKIVLLDFWFINCGPCWVKFPEVQEMHEKYESNPLVEIYAVNRPMRRDGPEELFTKIEEKDYTFPVLKGTQEAMDAFGVYKYPTVVLLNKKGEMVFMGELDAARVKLESLLEVN